MRIHLPRKPSLRLGRLLAASLALSLAAAAQAAPITTVYGSRGGAFWNSSTSGTSNSSTEVIGFTVGSTTYSTGVNNSLLTTSVGGVPGASLQTFRAFTPLGLTAGPNTLLANGSAMLGPGTSPVLTAYLTDGTQGLELATAVFNSPVQNVQFATAIPPSALGSTVPLIVGTQMGQPGTSDVYRFFDSSGTTVGAPVLVNYSTAPSTGSINWRFHNPDGTVSTTQSVGDRPIRMQAYTLADFGLTTASLLSQVVGFEQHLSGQSDVAFVAYNENLLRLLAPDMVVNVSGLPATAQAGVPYSGSFTCTNQGEAAANTNTTCTAGPLPAGLSVGACSISPPPAGAPWVAGNTVPVGSVVTCPVTGTPTAPGTTTVSASTTGSSQVTMGGVPVTTPDSDTTNNTLPRDVTVTAADMQFTSVNLPGATLGVPYSGGFVCTNGGTAAATAATCAPAGLPSWAILSCDPSTPTASPLAAGATIACTVSGTPNSTATSNVTITAGTSSTESNTGNNTGSGSIAVAAPDMRVDSVNLPPATVGEPYSGSFVCSNHGNAPAAGATCAPSVPLPAWAVVTCSPTPPVTRAAGEAITCTVAGTPATGDKGTTPVTITTGTDPSTPESDTGNNTGTGSLVVTGVPNVVIDLSGLPPTGNVNVPYTGSFTCTNNGTADATGALCGVSNLPPGLTQGACTISPPTPGTAWASPGDIPENAVVTCAVTGTPTQTGETPVQGQASSGGDSTPTTTTRVVTIGAAAAPIPTLSQWGQILMAGLLAAMGLLMVRRARAD